MRVLHVIPSVAARYGGPSAALKGMTAALAARGVSVSVATTNADGPGALEVPLDDEVTEDGVQYRFFARTLPGEYKFSWPLARWLRQHVRDFDVLHVHALFSFATIPACRSASRARVPYVLRPLGTLGSWSLAHRGWKKAPYLALVERRHLRDAAAIHATSEGERDALEALAVGGKTRVIPLGVEVAEAAVLRRREERMASRDMASGSAGLQLLFLSRLHPVKGLPLLFEAVARARELALLPETTDASRHT